MKVIHAITKDLFPILNIIHQAQKYLASLNIDQWQNGYPNEAKIQNDIDNQESFLVVNKENNIIATAMFTIHNEPTYRKIEGNWLTNDNTTYGVIHRMAVSDEYRNKGVAKLIFIHFEQFLITNRIISMRIDTHEDNLGMQNLLKKLGYKYCGVIYLEDGNKRLAFEKILEV